MTEEMTGAIPAAGLLQPDGIGKYTVLYDASRRYYGRLARRAMKDPVIASVIVRSKKRMFQTNVEQFLFNALVCRSYERRLRAVEPEAVVRIALPLDAMFRTVSRYKRCHMSYRHVDRIITAAHGAGWIDLDIGTTSFNNEGKGGYVTRVRPVGEFARLLDRYLGDVAGNVAHTPPDEVLELKIGKGKRAKMVEYRDSPETDAMRSRVEKLNQASRRLNVTIEVELGSRMMIADNLCASISILSPSPPSPPITLHSSASGHPDDEDELQPDLLIPRLVSPTEDGHLEDVYLTNHLRPVFRGARWVWTLDDWALTHVRKFVRGSWECGGRLYAPYQNLPRQCRPHVRIGGESTVLLDFSALHPTMLYHARGLECDGDPYDIGLPSIDRKSLKRVLNTMINAVNSQQLYESMRARIAKKEIDLSGFEPKVVVSAFRKRHSAIVSLLHKDYGIKLQRFDSDIALLVMERVECLGIHDGFIARRSLQDSLEHEMKRAYRQVVGGEIGVKVDS